MLTRGHCSVGKGVIVWMRFLKSGARNSIKPVQLHIQVWQMLSGPRLGGIRISVGVWEDGSQCIPVICLLGTSVWLEKCVAEVIGQLIFGPTLRLFG